jgi:hypothetical protein
LLIEKRVVKELLQLVSRCFYANFLLFEMETTLTTSFIILEKPRAVFMA